MVTEAQEMRGKIRKIRGSLNTRIAQIQSIGIESDENHAYVRALELALREIDLQFPTL